jgi:hypothetical protein
VIFEKNASRGPKFISHTGYVIIWADFKINPGRR